MGGLAYLGLDWVTYRCTLSHVLFMCTYWSSFMLSGQLLVLRGFNKRASKKVAADDNRVVEKFNKYYLSDFIYRTFELKVQYIYSFSVWWGFGGAGTAGKPKSFVRYSRHDRL